MLSKILNVTLVLLVLAYAGYYLYKMPKYASGDVAENFTTKLRDGSTFSLTDLRGNYVLLDFWGSWCGPCRLENPDLVKLHEKYKPSQKFTIVSVAIERSKRAWEGAIVKDGLNWQHHIYEEGRFNSPIAKLYSVKEIPTKYLISPDGDVISTNPSMIEIDQILSDKLH